MDGPMMDERAASLDVKTRTRAISRGMRAALAAGLVPDTATEAEHMENAARVDRMLMESGFLDLLAAGRRALEVIQGHEDAAASLGGVHFSDECACSWCRTKRELRAAIRKATGEVR